MASGKPLTKRAGSGSSEQIQGSGYVSKCQWPEHCLLSYLFFAFENIVWCSVADPKCLSRIRIFLSSRIRIFSIPDQNFFHPGSRISIKEFKYFNPKKWFLSFLKYDPSCSSRIRIRNTDLMFYLDWRRAATSTSPWWCWARSYRSWARGTRSNTSTTGTPSSPGWLRWGVKFGVLCTVKWGYGLTVG